MKKEQFLLVCDKFKLDEINRGWFRHYVEYECQGLIATEDEGGDWNIHRVEDNNFYLFNRLTKKKAEEIINFIRETEVLFI